VDDRALIYVNGNEITGEFNNGGISVKHVLPAGATTVVVRTLNTAAQGGFVMGIFDGTTFMGGTDDTWLDNSNTLFDATKNTEVPAGTANAISATLGAGSKGPCGTGASSYMSSDRSYIIRDTITWTAPGTDLPGQPMNGTISQCKSTCTGNSECVGFSRAKGQSDDTPGECWLKRDISNYASNNGTWQTYVKQ
jgi:hypothetical protein